MNVFAKGIGDPKDPSTFIHHFTNGDLKAFRLVFYQYYPALRFFANRLTEDEPAGERIVEECFASLWQQRARFLDLNAIKTFLYLSAHNGCFRFLKEWRKPGMEEKDWEEIWAMSECLVLREIVRAETIRTVDAMPDLVSRMQQTTTDQSVPTKDTNNIQQPKQGEKKKPSNKSPI